MANTLIGKKIELRVIDEKDTLLICKWRNNARVYNNFIFSERITPNIHKEWLDKRVKTGLVDQFIIIEKHASKPIGSTYFKNINREELTAEYGIFIGEDCAIGKGYSNEVVKMMLSYAFNNIGLNKVTLRVFEDNDIAIKSYKKAGFRLTSDKYTIIKNDEKRTVIIMEIDKEDYSNRR